MTLTDAGPLIALIDKGQGVAHQQCVEAQRSLRGPLLTTWPCFTEAMYFLGHLGGWHGQKALWKSLNQGAVLVHTPSVAEADHASPHGKVQGRSDGFGRCFNSSVS